MEKRDDLVVVLKWVLVKKRRICFVLVERVMNLRNAYME